MVEIYGSPTFCLGDCWAFINLMCQRSIQSNEVVYCSNFVRGRKMAGITPSLHSIEGKLREIMDVLDLGTARIELVNVPATEGWPADVDCFRSPYLPTKIRWDPGKHVRICHQFHNNQIADKNTRCPRPPHVTAIMKWLSEWPGEKVKLGLPMSIGDCVKVASESDLFIGMDSGMSHVCHSVGVPVVLSDWPRIDEFHFGKKFLRFRDANEAIVQMKSILQ